ncbi:MAG: hypothetical protein P1V51_00735 [Deltaproteobacteria bacterium]|nr:hypothetical protein [Deltaproteobacteria bacterium]
MRLALSSLALALFLTACGSAGTFESGASVGRAAILDGDEEAYIASLSEYERKGTVWLVNSALTTVQVLDVDCGLQSDAAKHIIREKLRRNGVFDTLEQIADVNNVGVYNLSRLTDCAYDKGWIQPDTTTLYESYAALPTYLQEAVDGLIVLAEESRVCDPSSGWGCYSADFRFYWAEVTGHGTVVTEASVQVGRVIDPEGGITETVTYTLDSDLEVVDAWWDAG